MGVKSFRVNLKDRESMAIMAGAKQVMRRPVMLREFGLSDTPGYDFCFRDRRALWNDVGAAMLMKWAPCAPGDLLIGREC